MVRTTKKIVFVALLLGKKTHLQIRHYKFIPFLYFYFYIKHAFRNGAKTFESFCIAYSINNNIVTIHAFINILNLSGNLK